MSLYFVLSIITLVDQRAPKPQRRRIRYMQLLGTIVPLAELSLSRRPNIIWVYSKPSWPDTELNSLSPRVKVPNPVKALTFRRAGVCSFEQTIVLTAQPPDRIHIIDARVVMIGFPSVG